MKDKMFSKELVFLMLVGFVVNVVMVFFTGLIRLPLYLDSAGTILVAVLGGILPGITVGFFSNVINYFFSVSNDPLTLYYGIISILIAITSVLLAKKGLYKKLSTTILAVFMLALAGGGLGSILTWLLYGFDFGENVSSNLVMTIYEYMKCPSFVAQLLGDYLVDLADKGIVLVSVYVILKIIPKKILESFPYGYKYIKNYKYEEKEDFEEIKCRKISLKGKLTILVTASSMILGLVSTVIGMYIHYTNSVQYYEKTGINIVNTIAALIDENEVNEYLVKGNEADSYDRICRELSVIENNNSDIEMISVFKMQNEKSRIIFDIREETQDSGNEVSYLVWQKELDDHINLLEKGEGIDTSSIRINRGSSVAIFKALYNEQKERVAYIVVQMNLSLVRESASVYFIRIFSLLFGIGIVIVAYLFWFYQHSILEPIKILIKQTKEAAKEKSEGERLRDYEQITTGDELEILFQDMCEAEDTIIRSNSASKSKTEFLSKLSHEIRTPLNSVIGFSQLALNDRVSITREDLLDYMQKIQLSGNYLLELVSDVLDISRIEEGRMTVANEACRLDELVDEVVNSFQGQMKNKNLEFIIDKDYGDLLLYMDEFHTIQILNNLISNAYKYTEEGGLVGFEIHAKRIEEKKAEIEFIVQDTGIGMSKEFQAKIFEPFTQDKRGMKMKKQLRGSGLGMSICKNLVELLGGTITLESEEGEGSCFRVKIPYEVIGRAKDQEIKKNQDYSILNGKKILVVDDVEMNRIVIEKFLTVYGLQFEDAEDGKQAVEKFKNSAEGEYFTIFMDVQMPEMNGHEATRIIRNQNRADAQLPIIGMTADAFSDDVQKAKDSGMSYHVTKPIQVQKVLNILMEILEK